MNNIKKLMVAALVAFVCMAAPFAAQADDGKMDTALADVIARVRAIEAQKTPGTSIMLEAMAADLAGLKACVCNTLAGVAEAQATVDRMESRFTRLAAATTQTRAELAAVRTVLEDYGRQLAELRAKDGEHDRVLAKHAEEIGALRSAQGATAGDVLALQQDVSDLKVRMAASEERERMFVAQFVAGVTAGYAGDMGGESREVGIFYKDGSRYKTSRLSLNPFVGASATYNRFYTDVTIGFVGETGNRGIGLRVQVHLGGNLGQAQRFTLGATSFYEMVKSGGGYGGTFSVIDSRLGAGVFAKYAIWQSPRKSASIDFGVQVAAESATAAVLNARMLFGALRADGLIVVRLGPAMPVFHLETLE